MNIFKQKSTGIIIQSSSIDKFISIYFNKRYYDHNALHTIVFALIPIQTHALVKGLVVELLHVGDIDPCGAL